MNGEVLLSMNIVKDLQGKEAFIQDQYVQQLDFHFAERGLFFSGIAENFTVWKKQLSSRKLRHAYLVLPNIAVDEWVHSGFSNAIRQGIYLKLAKKESLWVSQWNFDDQQKKWQVSYSESDMELPEKMYKLASNEKAFEQSLSAIAELAHIINEPSWEKIFLTAQQVLADETLPLATRLEKAVLASNVFGGMGSWVDSPPYSAETKNLSKEYTSCTSNLYEQRKLALMAAINSDE